MPSSPAARRTVNNIQSECPSGNTTNTLQLEAHADCLCGGSFFQDWIRCLDCDYVHGASSEQQVNEFNIIITSASHLLCTGTPTAGFVEIFNSLSEGTSSVSGATVMSDQFPSQTAISLYFTPSGSQGTGQVTGSAMAALAAAATTSHPSETASGPAATGSNVGSGSESSGASAAGSGTISSSSTSTSKNSAAPTGVVKGMHGVAAGGVLAAFL